MTVGKDDRGYYVATDYKDLEDEYIGMYFPACQQVEIAHGELGNIVDLPSLDGKTDRHVSIHHIDYYNNHFKYRDDKDNRYNVSCYDGVNFDDDVQKSKELGFPLCQYYYLDSKDNIHLVHRKPYLYTHDFADEFSEPVYYPHPDHKNRLEFIHKFDYREERKKLYYSVEYDGWDVKEIVIKRNKSSNSSVKLVTLNGTWAIVLEDYVNGQIVRKQGSPLREMESITSRKNSSVLKQYGLTPEMLNKIIEKDYFFVDEAIKDFGDYCLTMEEPKCIDNKLHDVEDKLYDVGNNSFKRIYKYNGKVLRGFWEDYLKDNFTRCDSVYLIDPDEIGYIVPVVALVPFKEHWYSLSEINNKAKLQVIVQGEYDELKFSCTNGLKVDKESVKNCGDRFEITVTVDNKKKMNSSSVGDGSRLGFVTINSVTKGIPQTAGMFRVKAYDPIFMKVCYINIRFMRKVIDQSGRKKKKEWIWWEKDPADYSNASWGESRYEWSRKKNDKCRDILKQAGIILEKEEDLNVIMDYGIIERIVDNNPRNPFSINNSNNTPVLESLIREGEYVDFGTRIDQEFMYNPRYIKEYDSAKYKDYVRVYLLDYSLSHEEDGDVRPTYGFSTTFDKTGCIFIFKRSFTIMNDMCRGVIGHEILHRLGLDHTFHNRNDYTFWAFHTENVMDYFSKRNVKHDIYTSHYQWRKMRENAKK